MFISCLKLENVLQSLTSRVVYGIMASYFYIHGERLIIGKVCKFPNNSWKNLPNTA